MCIEPPLGTSLALRQKFIPLAAFSNTSPFLRKAAPISAPFYQHRPPGGGELGCLCLNLVPF
jgi:hypothetical protein